MGEQPWQRHFQNFEVDIKITKFIKIGSNHQNFKEKFLKLLKHRISGQIGLCQDLLRYEIIERSLTAVAHQANSTAR